MTAARSGSCEVIVKCHPQQNQEVESARLAREAGALWRHGFSVAEIGADTRELIVAADAVVGFQTTALYEAVAARKSRHLCSLGRRVRAVSRASDSIRGGTGRMPAPGIICRAPCCAPAGSERGAGPACAAWYEQALGHIDGHATERGRGAPRGDRRRLAYRSRPARPDLRGDASPRRCSHDRWRRRLSGRSPHQWRR